jgi:hypothetical protein
MQRPIAVLEAEADEVAAEVLKSNQLNAFPICPRVIARKHDIGIQTRQSNEPGVTGFLMRVGHEFSIYHSSHIANDGFIRFTIAHELGHFFLPGHPEVLFPTGDGIHQSRGAFESNEWHEKQADFFASSLLMPRPLFEQALANLAPGFTAIQAMKDLCQMSVLATALRYAKLSTVPVAVVVSRDATVNYWWPSTAFQKLNGVGWLKKGSELPARCKTRQFNRKKSNVSCGRMDGAWASLDDWFPGAAQIVLKEDVVGLGSYGKTLTVLFVDSANA